MKGKIHLKISIGGTNRRFALSLNDDGLLALLKSRVATFIGNEDFALFWKDDESLITLENDEDLQAAVDFAQSRNRLGCISLVIGQKTEKGEGKVEAKATQAESAAAFNGFAFVCDGCDAFLAPSNGGRYKCCICCNYDLCKSCVDRGVHDNHAFVRLLNGDTEVPIKNDGGGVLSVRTGETHRCTPSLLVKSTDVRSERSDATIAVNYLEFRKAVFRQLSIDSLPPLPSPPQAAAPEVPSPATVYTSDIVLLSHKKRPNDEARKLTGEWVMLRRRSRRLTRQQQQLHTTLEHLGKEKADRERLIEILPSDSEQSLELKQLVVHIGYEMNSLMAQSERLEKDKEMIDSMMTKDAAPGSPPPVADSSSDVQLPMELRDGVCGGDTERWKEKLVRLRLHSQNEQRELQELKGKHDSHAFVRLETEGPNKIEGGGVLFKRTRETHRCTPSLLVKSDECRISEKSDADRVASTVLHWEEQKNEKPIDVHEFKKDSKNRQEKTKRGDMDYDWNPFEYLKKIKEQCSKRLAQDADEQSKREERTRKGMKLDVKLLRMLQQSEKIKEKLQELHTSLQEHSRKRETVRRAVAKYPQGERDGGQFLVQIGHEMDNDLSALREEVKHLERQKEMNERRLAQVRKARDEVTTSLVLDKIDTLMTPEWKSPVKADSMETFAKLRDKNTLIVDYAARMSPTEVVKSVVRIEKKAKQCLDNVDLENSLIYFWRAAAISEEFLRRPKYSVEEETIDTLKTITENSLREYERLAPMLDSLYRKKAQLKKEQETPRYGRVHRSRRGVQTKKKETAVRPPSPSEIFDGKKEVERNVDREENKQEHLQKAANWIYEDSTPPLDICIPHANGPFDTGPFSMGVYADYEETKWRREEQRRERRDARRREGDGEGRERIDGGEGRDYGEMREERGQDQREYDGGPRSNRKARKILSLDSQSPYPYLF